MSSVQRRLIFVAASFFAAVIGCTSSQDIRVQQDAGTSHGAAGDQVPGTAGSGGRQGSGIAGSSPTGSAGAGGVTSVGGTAGSGEGAGSGSGMAGTTNGTAGTTGAAGTTTGAAGTSSGAAGRDAGAADTSGTPAVTYTSYIEGLLIFRCGGCHYGTNMQGGFSITYANVMAHVSAATSGCANLDASKARIVPGKPDASLIYIKTNFTSPPGGCGGHMPYQNSSLLADQQADLRDWILAGAKQ